MTVLCYPVKGQLSSQVTLLPVCSHQNIALQLSHVMEQPIQRPAYLSACSACVGPEFGAPLARPLGKVLWGLPSIYFVETCLPPASACLLPSLASKRECHHHSLILKNSVLCEKLVYPMRTNLSLTITQILLNHYLYPLTCIYLIVVFLPLVSS